MAQAKAQEAPQAPVEEQGRPTERAIQVEVRQRQLAMIRNPARILYIGAGTKTGKTVALLLWIAEGILQGQATAWCGYIMPKSRRAYEALKAYLAYAEAVGAVTFNDTRMRIESTAGGSFTAFTGENPDAIYAEGYHRFVIDEASRQPQAVMTAAITTVSATRGKIRLAFNLDHGAKNWAIKSLLRVKAMTAEEREAAGADYMMFPTDEQSFVSAEDVALLRRNMPEAMARALFDAVIPEDEASLFHNLDEIFSGPGVRVADPSHTYIMGVDLARKQNWTVATVMDVTVRRLTAAIRFNQISWTLQYQKLVEFYQLWRCSRAWVDQSGLGDPVVNELEQRGMAVEGVIFTGPTRKALVEGLVVACDGPTIHASGDPEFAAHKAEMEAFEIVLGAQGQITYAVPSGMHDDAAFSAALAIHGSKQGNYGPPRLERPAAVARPISPRRIVGY